MCKKKCEVGTVVEMVKGRLATMAVGAGWGAGLQEEEDHLAEGDRGREDARLLRRRRKRRRRRRGGGGER